MESLLKFIDDNLRHTLRRVIILFVIFLAQIVFAEIKDVKFDLVHIELSHKKNKKTIQVEKAETDLQMQQGLMNRKSLNKDTGMIFIFKDEQIRSFWMKNTIIDLTIAFADKNNVIVDIQDMKATSVLELDPPSYFSRKPAKYAIEMTKGWFQKNKFPIGSKFKFLTKDNQQTKVQQ